MPRDVVDRIIAFNAGREPERLRLKYQAMYASAFRFLRGTCHLFYHDWPRHTPLNSAPPAWISGDLHLENFGTYKGDDGIIYFDINDFDEAVLAPFTWEPARLATSILVAAGEYDVGRGEAVRMARCCLESCAEALARGKARRVERLVADGMIRTLLDTLLLRKRAALLRSRTEMKGRKSVLRTGKRALPATAAERRLVTRVMGRFARGQEDPGFFRVLDVARRVAGTASLGVPRYVVLVYGRGGPDDHYLLDLKAARPSTLAKRSPCRQPRWHDEAERVATLQDSLQSVAPALLTPVTLGRDAFVLRELQPTEDRLDLSRWGGALDDVEYAMRTMGHLSAWAALRSSGRRGSASADELVAFARRPAWRGQVLRYAQRAARQVDQDWRAFRKAVKQGRIALGDGTPFVSDED
jgi:uncharacterized protein (DUF2252 family)